jgi:phospholipase/carboxylesterase
MVRPLRFVLPVGYERNYRYPLLIWLHSDGFNENQVSDVMPHISPQNYIGVGIRGSRSIDPAGHRFDWATSPAAIVRCEEAVWQAIDQAVERYSIHPERIFIAGYAEGGMMATRAALSHPESFAGCISIGGRFPTGGGVLSNLHAARSLPQMWAVGRDNPNIDQASFQSDLHLISTARLKMEIRQYTVDDEMVKEVLADVDRWIMNRINPPPSGPAPLDIWGSVEVGFPLGLSPR